MRQQANLKKERDRGDFRLPFSLLYRNYNFYKDYRKNIDKRKAQYISTLRSFLERLSHKFYPPFPQILPPFPTNSTPLSHKFYPPLHTLLASTLCPVWME